MESKASQDLRAQIIELQKERDHWKSQAERQQGSQISNDAPTVELGMPRVNSDGSRNAMVVDDEPENSVNQDAEVEITERLRLPIQTKVFGLQTDRTPELVLKDQPIHPSVVDDTQSDSSASQIEESHVERNRNAPVGVTGTSVLDTYDFMDDFPRGEWWTSLDEGGGCSRSLDFGVNGFTASLNTGHELLQITAPHSENGVVSIRGSFDDNSDAILARAQRSVGGKSTFGLKWAGDIPSSYNCSDRIAYHGLLNFRWPYKKHVLFCHGLIPGTISSFSFLKEDMVYQILRFKPGQVYHSDSNTKLDRGEITSHPSSPQPEGQLLQHPDALTTGDLPSKDPWNHSCRIELGGMIRPYQSLIPARKPHYVTRLSGNTLSCNIPQQGLQLSFELFMNGEKKALSFASPVEHHDLEVNMMTEASFRLWPGKITTLVGRISLRSETDPPFNVPLPTSDELVEYLGASQTSENATDRVWANRIDMNAEIDYDDFCFSAACLEQILGVTSVPMRHFWRPLQPACKPSGTSASPIDVDADSKLPLTNPDFAGHTSTIDPAKRINLGIAVLPLDGNMRIPTSQTKSDEGFSVTPQIELVSANSEVRPPDEFMPHSSNEFIKNDDRPVPGSVADCIDPDPASIRPSGILGTASAIITPTEARHETNTGNQTSARELVYASDLSSDGSSIMMAKANVLAMDDPDMGIALLANILGNQFVDVQKSFWQIRYLVKAHNFLALPSENLILELNKDTSAFEEPRGLDKVRATYLDRIKFQIHHCLVWMARVELPTGRHTLPTVKPYSRSTNYVRGSIDIENDRTLYPPLAIWFVMQNCPDALPPIFMNTLLESIQNLKTQEIGEFDITSSDHTAKSAILLWYRYACLARIMQHLRDVLGNKDSSMNTDLVENAAVASDLEITEFTKESHAWQSRAEKSMASFRRAPMDSYSDEDEAADRLSFLGVELGFVGEHDVNIPKSCLAQTRRRILNRRPTVYLNPGAPLFGQDGSAKLPITAPWELSCANHHIRLQLWKWRDPEIEHGVDLARKDCLRYRSLNWLFVGSWDTSKSNVSATFWDLDISAMVSATLLDMRTMSGSSDLVFDAAPPERFESKPPHAPSRPSSVAIAPEVAKDGLHTEADRAKPCEKRDFAEDGIADLLRKQLEKQDTLIQTLTKQGNDASEFDWTRWKPQDPFIPDEWIQSLDDTPHLFRPAHTRTIYSFATWS
ncbi:hypothetical protein VTL71DRAFT_3679 [Oculimacula yallundae]|uniref:Uncharacterized protein n=1 Tax=Oculimacula yallundae TaxID=86028 RepID=A0ABR4C4B0_9HELO